MKELFEEFLKEKKYLKNCSENTLQYYRYCFKALAKYVSEPTDINLETWVVRCGDTSYTLHCYRSSGNVEI